jgi:hypothetical protein
MPGISECSTIGSLSEGLVQGHAAKGAGLNPRDRAAWWRLLRIDHRRFNQPLRQLSVGGYAILDDYAEDAWTHCRRAVDDFRRQREIKEPLIQVYSKCFYWKRER